MKLNTIENEIPFVTADDVVSSFGVRKTSYSKSSKLSLQKSSNSRLKFFKRPESGNFNRSRRAELFRVCQTPGPGDYEKSPLSSGPRYSMPGKSKEKAPVSPGPGSYSPIAIHRSAKGSRIGKSLRPEFFESSCKTPGPGRYESHSRSITPSWTFQKTQELSTSCQTPGPGKYEGRALSKGIQYSSTTARRKEIFPGSDTPGPGTYDSFKSFNTARYSIGKAKRMPEDLAAQNKARNSRRLIKRKNEEVPLNGLKDFKLQKNFEIFGISAKSNEKETRVYLTKTKFETRDNCRAPDFEEV
jgi:hypothetical protein